MLSRQLRIASIRAGYALANSGCPAEEYTAIRVVNSGAIPKLLRL